MDSTSVMNGHYQTVGFRVWHGKNLVKVGQTRWYLINGLKTTRLWEIHIRILIIEIEIWEQLNDQIG